MVGETLLSIHFKNRTLKYKRGPIREWVLVGMGKGEWKG
jgi:hypothetical protein